MVDDSKSLFRQRFGGETDSAAPAVDTVAALRGLHRRLRRFNKLRP
jgi:hypothetical protein